MPTAVVIDASGVVAMIVHADKDAQLDDPAANPPGCTQVRVERKQYDACRTLDDVASLAVATVEKVDPRIAQELAVRVETAKTLKLQADAEKAAFAKFHAEELEKAQASRNTKRVEELLRAEK